MAKKPTSRVSAKVDNLSPEHLNTLRWLNTAQAMAYVQVSRSTLLELQNSGSLPYSRLSERVIRYDRLALDKWIADNTVAAGQ